MSAPGTPVSKIASQASSAEPSPAIQALHQAQNAPAPTTLEMQRQLLQQKLAEQKNAPFTSPTDDMMTPCTKKRLLGTWTNYLSAEASQSFSPSRLGSREVLRSPEAYSVAPASHR